MLIACGSHAERTRWSASFPAIDARNVSMSDIAHAVIEQIAAVLSKDLRQVTPDARLAHDLGVDSLGYVALVLAIEDRFAIDMPDEEVEQLRTVQQLIEYVELAVAMQRPGNRRVGPAVGVESNHR
jgi:acyl carrier protein